MRQIHCHKSIFDTNFVFTPGRLTFTLDAGAGSSGKGKLGSFLCENADNWQFACNTFMPQAAHWVRVDDPDRSYVYTTLNSCAYLVDRYEKLYIAPGATIELSELEREIKENEIPRHKLGISPLTSILQDIDGSFEKGTCDLDGRSIESADGGYLTKTGTTAKGCGVNRARRALRHHTARYARDVPELQDLLCDVPREIMRRLDDGQAGLVEVAQGFQLSYLLPEFFPYTTSRNCTVSAALDDLMIPPIYAGTVILNLRTFPIRINNDKYIDIRTGDHLTMKDVVARTGLLFQSVNEEALRSAGIRREMGDSGPGYSDQLELEWDEITRASGSPAPISELTTKTGLPRRVFTFSRTNLEHSILHNRTQGDLFLSLNFANYISHSLFGLRARLSNGEPRPAVLSEWLAANLGEHVGRLRFVGTGPMSNDMIQLG